VACDVAKILFNFSCVYRAPTLFTRVLFFSRYYFCVDSDSFEKRHSFSVELNNLYRASTLFTRVAQSDAVVSEYKLNLLR